jgi:hypothetical protein
MVFVFTFLTREKGSPYSTTALTKLIQNELGDDRTSSIPLLQRKVWVAAILLFVFAFSVRAVISLNYEYQSRQVMTVLTDIYKMDARNLASGDLKTFLEGPNPPIDAHILSHPPGTRSFSRRSSRYLVIRTRRSSFCRRRRILLQSFDLFSRSTIFLVCRRR